MTIVYFIIMLGIIIIIHELGHMLFAKLFNVYVKEFAIGFGPRLWSHRTKETVYSIRAIPLGGFTAMADEMDDHIEDQSEKDDSSLPPDLPKERTFNGVKPWKRIIIMLAGPLFNILLASVVFIAIITVNGGISEAPKPVIASVVDGMPAAQAGMQAGDLIVKVTYSDGSSIKPDTFSDIVQYTELYHDAAIYTVQRGAQTLEFTITPQYDTETTRYMIGVTSGDYTFKSMNFLQAVPAGIGLCWEVTLLTLKALANLFKGIGLDSLSGTIGIYKSTEQAVSYGFMTYLSLIGSLSVNLALMNLLPIPLVDGGRILITIIETIIGHRLSIKTQNILMYGSLVLLFGLLIIVTYKDIVKYFL